MGTPLDFIYDNNLQWQASLKGATSVAGRLGYRGALIITEGKVLSADKQLPPKATLKQALIIADEEKFLFMAGELETFESFEPLIEKYKSVLTPETLITLFVVDLDANVMFEYEGLHIYAYALDESSVWNELVDYADLSKGDLKKLSAEEKLDALYDELKNTNLILVEKSYEEAKTLQNNDKKTLFGAV
jgi:hypothetical protein